MTIRTDKPEAEISLYRDNSLISKETWQAHRELSSTIHKKIHTLLQGQKLDWHDVGGIVFFSGPGSFTGLRIGATVANTIVATLNIPVVGTKDTGWIADGIALLLSGKNHKIVLPFYGRDPHITTPKK